MSKPMSCDAFEAALPWLIDGEAEDAMMAHTFDCERCAALLADLSHIRGQARALPMLTPSRDLWREVERGMAVPSAEPQVAGVSHGRSRRERAAIRRPAALAAGLALCVLTSLAVQRAIAPTPVAIDAVGAARERHAAEIAPLWSALNDRRGSRDSAVTEVVRRDLGGIDHAIRECEAALTRDPTSPFLRRSLADAYASEVDLLRMAVTIADEH